MDQTKSENSENILCETNEVYLGVNNSLQPYILKVAA